MDSQRIPNRGYLAPIVLADALARLGVADACISPGSRSTPLALALVGHGSIRCWSHVDERSGSFFALGLARASRRPVVLACTSGTAAANFLPAVVEAWHARIPLIVLTADRPPELRDCGAGQTIDQLRLYGSHARWFAEVSIPEPTREAVHWLRSTARRAIAESQGPPAGPVHLNLPLREPLVPVEIPGDVPEDVARLCGEAWPGISHSCDPPQRRASRAAIESAADALAVARRPLLVAGPMDDPDEDLVDAVVELSDVLGAPVLAEPASNLRRGALRNRIVPSHEAVVRSESFASTHEADAVVRLGAPPTSKPLSTWLSRRREVPLVLLDAGSGFLDPAAAATAVLQSDSAIGCRDLAAALRARRAAAPSGEAWASGWRGSGELAAQALVASRARDRAPFEAHVVAAVAAAVPEGALLYVGNSLAIRAVDWFWPPDAPGLRILANRGANGIDGFVSSVLGAAAAHDAPVVGLCGDLSFYHDLNGLLASRRYGVRAVFVVMNNDGGGIFDFLPIANHRERYEEFFSTPHGLDFESIVGGFGVAWERVEDPREIAVAIRRGLDGPCASVVEVAIDRAQSVAAHRRGWDVVRDVLGEAK